jgi:hypothetical protein
MYLSQIDERTSSMESREEKATREEQIDETIRNRIRDKPNNDDFKDDFRQLRRRRLTTLH